MSMMHGQTNIKFNSCPWHELKTEWFDMKPISGVTTVSEEGSISVTE